MTTAPARPRVPATDRTAALARLAPLAIPAAGTAYLAFQSGGFFAGQPALVAAVVLAGLVLWITLADHPLAGASTGLLVAGGGMAAFAVWALLSGSWSPAPGRALPEYDRALAYLVAMVATGLAARTTGRLAAAAYATLAVMVVACGAGLISRLLPAVLDVRPDVALDRLSYPLTYWNGLGIFAAAGLLLAVGITASAEQRAVRLLTAAAAPVLATTLVLSFSRGAIAAAGLGLLVLLAAGRPARWIGGLTAAVVGCALPVLATFGSDVLVTKDYLSASGRDEGSQVALLLVAGVLAGVALRLALEPLDTRTAPALARGWRRIPRLGRAGALAAVVAVVVAGLLAAGAPGFVHDKYERFLQGEVPAAAKDQRQRLLDTNNNGRLDHWRVALDGFRAEPLHGAGAGTFQTAWARDRHNDLNVVDAHSLYIEVLGELGIVGLALVLVPILAVLWGLARLARGPDRGVPAAALAAGVAWAVHGGVDWDWELPATGFWLFALGGLALASPAGVPRLAAPRRLARVVAALGCLVLIVTPITLIRSQTALAPAGRELLAGNCPAAIDHALASARAVGSRPEPYEVIGFCDVRLGFHSLAVRNLRQAVDRDPEWWETWYGLALVQGAVGQDPRAAARRALQLNPREPLAQRAARTFGETPRSGWSRAARRLPLPMG